jgi:hypothetical protein
MKTTAVAASPAAIRKVISGISAATIRGLRVELSIPTLIRLAAEGR